MEAINIKRNAEKMNQKVPRSNIVPKRDTCVALEKMDESKKDTTIPPAASRVVDRGKLILPSKNRAKHQLITQTASPTTRRTPLAVSTGTLLKGKKKTGNKIITKKIDKKETLSYMFERMWIVYQ